MRQSRSIEELIEGWDGDGVVVRHDGESGAWIFIALHDGTLGPPTGGTRMATYPAPAAGLLDAMRLAEGMTHKWAAAGVHFGGGKAVVAVPDGLAGEVRRGLLHRYGELVESLQGAFVTGEDLGTTPADMEEIASRTRWVLGGHGGDGRLADPGPFTARGVLAAVRAVVARTVRDGDPGGRLDGVRVLVQGVGDVGEPLARDLAAAGATLLLADTDATRAERLAGELGAEAVPADRVYGTECDVFAPCAVGAVLNPDTVPRLACRAVAGSANNQLDSDADADALHERGILYAPDYVANAGGAIAFAHLTEDRNAGRGELFERVGRIREILEAVFEEAERRGESPLHAARRRVDRILAAGPPKTA